MPTSSLLSGGDVGRHLDVPSSTRHAGSVEQNRSIEPGKLEDGLVGLLTKDVTPRHRMAFERVEDQRLGMPTHRR
ncbi:MAG: hypothetical protein CM15mP128_1530 [Methanobacteriota archaeon]|nr:MAG: hypothetical protein CM15mP128_1530 [Euryarchaeota archaeon]